MAAARIVAVALAALGAAVLLLPSVRSTATTCDAADLCVSAQTWQVPSLVGLVGSVLFATVIYVFVTKRSTLRVTGLR